jgi:hypothetical protein
VTGMAHGYGVMADKPSLTLLHVACGISNGLANMHNGRRAGAPMIVFAGGVAANHEVNNPEHQMLLRPQLIAAADWYREALTSDLLADSASEALQVANTGNGKVAMIFGPAQTFWEEATVIEDQNRPPIPPRRVSSSTIWEHRSSASRGRRWAREPTGSGGARRRTPRTPEPGYHRAGFSLAATSNIGAARRRHHPMMRARLLARCVTSRLGIASRPQRGEAITSISPSPTHFSVGQNVDSFALGSHFVRQSRKTWRFLWEGN